MSSFMIYVKTNIDTKLPVKPTQCDNYTLEEAIEEAVDMLAELPGDSGYIRGPDTTDKFPIHVTYYSKDKVILAQAEIRLLKL